jgi:hypothetical protein
VHINTQVIKHLHFSKRIKHLKYSEHKNLTENHKKNTKKTTIFVFNKRSVTSMRKCPTIQYVVSDSGHFPQKD